MRRLRATANPYGYDRDPLDTERAILEVLSELPLWDSMTRGKLQSELYGTTLVGANRMTSALGRLRNKRLVERTPSGRWRATEAGRLWLLHGDVFEPEGTA